MVCCQLCIHPFISPSVCQSSVFLTFFLNACRYWLDFLYVIQLPWLTDQVRVTLYCFLAKLRALDLVKFQRSNSFLDFFLNTCRYWLIFGMSYIIIIKFEFCYAPSIFGEITGLGLSKYQWSNSFPHFFSTKHLQILSWFLACKSTTRSSLSLTTLHWFLAKLRAFDLVNFRDQTVFWTFFLNTCRFWADFWHVSQSQWLTDQVWVLLCSINFSWNYGPWT